MVNHAGLKTRVKKNNILLTWNARDSKSHVGDYVTWMLSDFLNIILCFSVKALKTLGNQ